MNNAGVAGKDWEKTTSINLSGVYYGLLHGCPIMAAQGGGAVVNTASVAGLGALMRQPTPRRWKASAPMSPQSTAWSA